jgi:hypothetical protein
MISSPSGRPVFTFEKTPVAPQAFARPWFRDAVPFNNGFVFFCSALACVRAYG